MGSIPQPAALQLAESSDPVTPFSRISRIVDVAAWSGWFALALVGVLHHEKWADEAQSWLLARDLDLGTLWFKELRYEGSPGLWHSILWFAQRVLHIPYAGLGGIGLFFAASGVAVILWRAPFPKLLVWLLPFSYFILYQYGVLARPYTLLALLAFGSAILFKDERHPGRITIVLALLANLSVHGMLLTVCVGAAYLVRGSLTWGTFDRGVKQRYLLSSAFMFLLFVFLFIVLKPPADVAAMSKVHQITTGQFLTRMWSGVSGAFFDFSSLTATWLLLLCAWCYMRRGWVHWLPLWMILLLGVFYGLYGDEHHQGTIFVAGIAGLWIAWPGAAERSTFTIHQRRTHIVFATFFGCLLAYQIGNTAFALRNDYRYPYSGAPDAANYLKSAGADQRRIVGLGYSFVAVQAYFDRNILVNRSTEYYHHSYPPSANKLALVDEYHPDYVVIQSWYDPDGDIERFRAYLEKRGYSFVHASDGYAFFKRSFETRQVYFTFRRNDLR